MIYEAANYMEGIEDHFQANQLLRGYQCFGSRSRFESLILATLIPITHQFDELRYNKKKEKIYILKVDRSIVMLNSVDYFFKSNFVVFF